MREGGEVLWRCRERVIRFGSRPLIMGILNVTPDSFSDGGRFVTPEAAIEHGLAMARDGADIIDVGGESTRPGAAPTPPEEELARVVPVIEGLCRAWRGTEAPLIAVDTRKAVVADRALAAGAAIVNDVSALTADDGMADVVRRYQAGVVLMHMRGEPATMQQEPCYEDVVREVAAYLDRRVADLCARGIDRETLALDPGIGFGKTLEHNLQVLARLDAFVRLGRPVVVGLSRKSFLGKLTGRETGERLAGSLAGLVFAVMRGARIVRVHDVRESVDAARVVAALDREHATWHG
jgi:dihydropteroate synthase